MKYCSITRFFYTSAFLSAFLVLLISFPALSQSYKQDLHHSYVPVVSQGLLPEILLKTASEKTNEAIGGIVRNSPDYKIASYYYTTTIFSEDEDLKSGKILFNTLINDYLNRILDVILVKDSALRKKISIYPICENESNAWALDNGHIYISLDYIAQFNTEAQLAMTLCHELAHVTKKHHYERFVKRAEILKSMSKVFYEDSLLYKERRFFKVQESDADLTGLNFFKSTNYKTSDLPEKFELMLLSDYSFENLPFNTGFFNQNAFAINKNIFYSEIKPVRVDINYDDTWDTHPNIYKRKKAIEEALAGHASENEKSFIVSKDTFEYVRDLCRFETAALNAKEGDLESAVYHSYCLLQKFPENIFLKELIANSLKQMAILKSYDIFHMGFLNYLGIKDNVKTNSNRDSTMGHIAQIKKLFNRLNGEDFTILAINYNYNLLKSTNYSNEMIRTNVDTLVNILSNIHNLNYLDLCGVAEEPKTEANADSKSRSFVKAIDRKCAFGDFRNDPAFKHFFRDTVSVNEYGFKYVSKGKTKVYGTKSASPSENIKDIKNIILDKTEIKNVKSLVYTVPAFYSYVYMAGDIESKPYIAEKNARYYETQLEAKSKENGLKISRLENSRFGQSETDKYNAVGIVNRIFDETDEHYSAPSSGIINIKGDNVAAKYDTPYFLRVQVYEIVFDDVKFNINGFVFKKDIKEFQYLFEIVNVKTGYIVYHRSYEAPGKIDEFVMRNMIAIDLNNIRELQN